MPRVTIYLPSDFQAQPHSFTVVDYIRAWRHGRQIGHRHQFLRFP